MAVRLDLPKFKQQVEAASKEIVVDLDVIVRAVALNLFDDIIKQTPVDTGALRGSWVLSVNHIAASGGDTTSSAQTKLSSAGLGDIVYISNHLPYARVIEYGEYPGKGPKTTADGYSTQAPRGIVRVCVQRQAMKFRREIRKIGRR